MPTTDNYAIPYPDPNSLVIDGPAQMQALAETVDDVLTNTAAGVASELLFQVETTASNSYTDLATAGPEVAVTVGPSGRALVTVGARMSNDGTGTSNMSFSWSGPGGSGGNVSDSRAVAATGAEAQLSLTLLLTGLTPGVNTFTAKYRTTTGISTFLNRVLTVQPL